MLSAAATLACLSATAQRLWRGKSDAFQQGVRRASNVASSIGPDRFNEDIDCLLANGVAPLL
jgi:hypothetical protein